SSGMVKPEFHLDRERESFGRLPLDAFQLSLEGQSLDGTWEWVNATQSEAHKPDGLLVTLELKSKARPVTVKVKPLLSGGPVMVRWLEITNTGSKATGLSSVSPWSGMLWNTPTYQERIKPNESPFELAYAQYEEWGHEGAWKFEQIYNTTKTITG